MANGQQSFEITCPETLPMHDRAGYAKDAQRVPWRFPGRHPPVSSPLVAGV
jgi:hypothetical protein